LELSCDKAPALTAHSTATSAIDTNAPRSGMASSLHGFRCLPAREDRLAAAVLENYTA
jgi:hypothetical protein